VVQGFAQLKYLVKSLRIYDTTGDLYQMMLEYTQLECHIAILEANVARYESTIPTKTWLIEGWRYISL
jgi:hypothetical protein